MHEILPKKYIILMEVATEEYHTLNQIAEKIGITRQGVYEYLKKMRGDGLIEIVDGKYKATVKGVEILFSYLDELDKYLNEKREKLNMIKCSPAIAGEDVLKGDRVFLKMEDGYLYAYKNKKTLATGEAIENASRGEDVGIKNIEGIIDLSLGKIFLISLPSITRGGSKKVNLEKLSKKLEEIRVDKTGITDIVGKITLKKLKRKYDFEFSPIQTSIEIAQKGLNVALVGDEKEMKHAVSKIEEYNANAIDEIKYELWNAE